MNPESIYYLRSIEVLKQAKILNAVENKALHSLLEQMTYTVLEKEVVIQGVDEAERYMYFILSGKVKEYQIDTVTGREHTHFLLSTGEMFDLFGLMNKEKHFVFWETMSEVEVLRIRKEAMQEWLCTSPEFQNNMLSFAAHRVRVLENMVTDTSLHDTLTRLSELLLNNIDDQSKKLVFLDSMSNSEIAKILGSTRAVVNRHIQQLKQYGAISVGRETIQLENVEVLRKICQGRQETIIV